MDLWCTTRHFMTFYWKFVDTLVYNVATICGFIVGLSQFLIRAYNENNGADKVRKFVNQSLLLANKATSAAYVYANQDAFEQPAEVKVTQTRTRKRRAA
mgnify:CR=1 FL=1